MSLAMIAVLLGWFHHALGGWGLPAGVVGAVILLPTLKYRRYWEILERDLLLDDDAGILDTPGSPCNPRKATDGRAQVWIQSALRNYRYFLRSSSDQLGPTNGRVERGNNTLLKPAELKSPNSNFGTPRQLSSLSLGNQEREGHGFRRAARSAKVSALAAEVLSHRFRLLLRSGSPSLGLEGMIEEVSQDARGDEHHSESE